MTTLLAEPTTRVLVDTDTQPGNGSVAHIVWADETKHTPQAIVLRARIEGTPVEALCGYVWVPHKNPQSLPVCEACKAIYELRLRPGQNNGELPEA